jgi:hypothetical protein
MLANARTFRQLVLDPQSNNQGSAQVAEHPYSMDYLLAFSGTLILALSQ